MKILILKFTNVYITIQTAVMKKFFLILAFNLIMMPFFAQVAVDIFDPFYDDLADWENVGLINYAPNIRPLPLQEIERILNVVMEAGNARERDVATEHYNRIFKRAFHFGVAANTSFRFVKGEETLKFFDLTPIVDLNYNIAKYLSVSASVKVHLTNKIPNNEPLPKFSFSNRDIKNDSAGIGRFKILPAFNSGVTLGNSTYYFSANMARTSYGPFPNSGIFISKDAKHQGQFVLVLNKPIVSFAQGLLAITATDDSGIYVNPNKFLSFHSLNIRPLEWLSFGIVDSVIFGGRFDPTYLLPFSVFFTSQGLFGFPDNSLIGVNFSVKPIDGLRIDGAVYADDLGFNEIIKFKKDVKARVSGQFGVSYTMTMPHWFKSASLDYTFIMPYTYTHIGNVGSTIESRAANYENYTHYGQNLASTLNPNSDRINLKLQFEPITNLKITLTNTFIRHANVNESVTDPSFLVKYMTEKYNTTGNVFNHASVDSPDKNGNSARLDLFLFSNPFMKQKTIEYINQLALDISCVLPILRSNGYMKFYLGYCFEVDINPGVNNPMFYISETSKKWKGAVLSEVNSGNFTTSAGSFTTQEILDEANKQKAEWKEKAMGKKFRHYIKIGAMFAY